MSIVIMIINGIVESINPKSKLEKWTQMSKDRWDWDLPNEVRGWQGLI